MHREPGTISATANFFALGGHSLLAIRFINATNEYFKIELSVKSLFNLQTVGLIGEFVDELIMRDALSKRLSAIPEQQLFEIEI